MHMVRGPVVIDVHIDHEISLPKNGRVAELARVSQAPHPPLSHPVLVPVRPNLSLTVKLSISPDSISTSRCCPLSVTLIFNFEYHLVPLDAALFTVSLRRILASLLL